MIRFLIWLVVILAVLGGLSWAILEHSGYVLIAWRNVRYESSLWVFLLLLALVFTAVWLIRWVSKVLLVSGGLVNPWSRHNHHRRQRVAAEKGLLELAEGRWEQAARHLPLAAEGENQPLPYYLGAARAANELGRYEQSDEFLERALQRQPQAELAIALTHAELQQARGDSQAAVETLQVMRERHPHQRQVLHALQALLVARGDWAALLALMPELRKSKVLVGEELAELERTVWQGRLVAAGADGQNLGETALQPLTAAWQDLSSAQRNDPGLLAAYAGQLRILGAQEEAEEVIRKALKQRYDARLIQVYGLLRGRDPARQLQTAEALLKEHESDPILLLSLGRLCLQNGLWGKAREYFELSLSFSHSVDARVELARLLAAQGDIEESNRLLLESFRSQVELPLPQRA